MFDLLADRLSGSPAAFELPDDFDLLAMRASDSSLPLVPDSLAIVPATAVTAPLDSALVLPEAAVAVPNLKRKLFSRMVDGRRVRTSKPGAEVMSKRDSLSKARERKQKYRADRLKSTVQGSLRDVANELLAKTRAGKRVRNQFRLKLQMSVCSSKTVARLESLTAKLTDDKGNRSRVSSADISEIALDQGGNCKSRAKTHHTSERTERRLTQAHAGAALLANEVLLLAVEEQLRRNPPDWSLSVPLWDETAEKVQVLVPSVHRHVVATMQMFVYIVHFSWGWKSGLRYSIKVVCPPLPITTTSASKLWDALRTHPFTRPLFRFKLALLELTLELPLEVPATDQASGNTKLLSFQLLVSPDTLLEGIPCLNHQNFLGHMDVVLSSFSASFLGRLHSSARFFNMSAHRLRCVMVAPVHIRSHTHFVAGYPAPSDIAFASELVSYVKVWERDDHSNVKSSVLLERYFQLVGSGYGGIASFPKIGRAIVNNICRATQPHMYISIYIYIYLFSHDEGNRQGHCKQNSQGHSTSCICITYIYIYIYIFVFPR
jgi:hypothetical protein